MSIPYPDSPAASPTAFEGGVVRVALMLEYSGKEYCGSQYQSHQGTVLPTIQGALQEALRRLNLRFSSMGFAGRTDAGVHAQGQVAHFDVAASDLKRIPHSLATSLNAVLPASVGVRAFRLPSDARFNSQTQATHRWYRYLVFNHPNRSPWLPDNALHVRAPLDVDAMREAARQLKGTHNFGAFKCFNTDVLDNVCRVDHAMVRRHGDWVCFDIVANRFVYKMVRNLTGALMEVGHHRLPVESISEMLASGATLTRISQRKTPTAKPDGLTFMAARYPEPYHYFAQEPNLLALEAMIASGASGDGLLKPIFFNPMESMQDENLFRKAS